MRWLLVPGVPRRQRAPHGGVDEIGFGVGVGVARFHRRSAVAPGEFALELLVVGRRVGVVAQVLTEGQVVLFPGAFGFTNVDMMRMRPFVRLVKEWIVGVVRVWLVSVSGARQGSAVWIHRVKRFDGDLNVDDRFRAEARDRRRPDMIDPNRDVTESVAKASGFALEGDRPLGVVLHDLDGIFDHEREPSPTWCGIRVPLQPNYPPVSSTSVIGFSDASR